MHLMEMDAELKSENSATAGETARIGWGNRRSRFAPEAAAVDPLRDALAALDRRDYATAQRLFESLGRKEAATAIEDALAALGRKDYAGGSRAF
jgi:hypothetical protein